MVYTVIMKQTFVLDKCEINVEQKISSETHVNLHKLRMSKKC